MKLLSDIVLSVLDTSVTRAALRFSVRGLGPEICLSMVNSRRNLGVGGRSSVRSHSLFISESEIGRGDSWPMPAGVKAGILKAFRL